MDFVCLFVCLLHQLVRSDPPAYRFGRGVVILHHKIWHVMKYHTCPQAWTNSNPSHGK